MIERIRCLHCQNDSAIDMPALFLAAAASNFVHHLDALHQALLAVTMRPSSPAGEPDVLELYRAITELRKMHNAFIPE